MKNPQVTQQVLTLAYSPDYAAKAEAISAQAKAFVQKALGTAHAPANVPDSIESLIMGFAAKKAAAKETLKGKPGRKSVLQEIREAVKAGKMPPPLEFASISNYTYNRHADTLHKLAGEGDKGAVQSYEINGCNTYSKALRGYRDLLVEYLETTTEAA